MSNKEIWRDVPGFVGQYKVSNHGRLISLSRYCHTWYGSRQVNQKLLKVSLKLDEHGRPTTTLISLGNRENRIRTSLARIVLLAFVGSPPGKHDIAHCKDGDVTNCHVSNLEWISHSTLTKRNNAERRLLNLFGE